jgi:hemerythrin
MERIIWDSGFSVGIPALDEQHKRLVGMINTMIQAHDAGVDSEVVSEVLDEMTRYAAEHFASEEALMQEHGFPCFDEHKEKHVSFRRDVAQLCFDATTGKTAVPEDILRFLRDWLVDHILYCDMRYAQFLGQAGIALRDACDPPTPSQGAEPADLP